jgi:hypothetical protein
MSEDDPLSGNPQRRLFEPVPKYKPKMKFVPGMGMVPDPDDMPLALQYDVNEAAADFEAETRQHRSSANVGYSALKRR